MPKALGLVPGTAKKNLLLGTHRFLSDSLFTMSIPHSPDKGVNTLESKVYQCDSVLAGFKTLWCPATHVCVVGEQVCVRGHGFL